MSELETTQTVPQSTALSTFDESAKNNALIAYGFMMLGLLTGAFWIVGAVWAMVKKGDAKGSRFEDHYTNIISTFWWGLGLSLIGIVLSLVIIGWFILLGVWIWSIYRMVKGLAAITSNRGYKSPAPNTDIQP